MKPLDCGWIGIQLAARRNGALGAGLGNGVLLIGRSKELLECGFFAALDQPNE
ncbi:MAG: hypothetical protein ACRYGK_17010 [Janthinobacterium lividum]